VPNNDPDLIYQSAKLFLGDPLIQMEQAHQLVKERCTLDPVAFGIIASLALSGEYEQARGYAEKNLGDGVDKVRETGEKLADVAQKWGEVDAHNSIMLLASPKPPALPPLQSHGSPQAGQALFGGAGVAAGTIMALVMRNAMTATMLRAAGELEIMAAAAMVFWVLFMPDEDALNKAVDSWANANTTLTACGNAVTAAAGPAGKGWNGDDRNAFDQYLVVLKQDITDAASGAKLNSDALQKIIEQLNDSQTTFLELVLIAMASLIVLAVIAKTPGPQAIPAEILKKTIGFELAAATAEVVYGVWKTVSEGLKPVKDWWAGASLLFARPRAGAPTMAGGSGNTFASVKIDWAP
jgi:hypothetical protein